MTERWFRLPTTTVDQEGESVEFPKYIDEMGLDAAGTRAHPDGPPAWIVHVYGSTADLDALADELDVVDLEGVPVDALNAIRGVDRGADEWDRGFSTSGASDS